ncbi:hypothetical protein [Microbacterium hydrocarbonoxydans]|uniref:hypothetical protein n=1 Tax=Microbacterium hydrocarbonoxydans TaxID=273678 RepID=UPI0013D9F52D|nr:hypothetical protein [Microbacterium hydrocarbonoxydans]
MSLDEFRASLLRADVRESLGIRLADDEAQRVHDDATASRNWYEYWLATQPAPPAAAAPAPAAHTAPAAYAAPGDAVGHRVPIPSYPGDAQPTAPLYAAAPPPAYDPAAAPPPYGFVGAQEPQPYPYGIPAADAVAAGPRRRNAGLWVALSVIGALILIAIVVVVAAFATARHWTKIDVPEQPETFHTEEYETGRYDVTMDTVNPCWVDQDWTDCTNLMVATYNGACVDVQLTADAAALCDEYSAAIEEMKAQDGDGYTVASLGSFGNLHRAAETATREVSNNDGRPAVTHEAVCYLGFIGECR